MQQYIDNEVLDKDLAAFEAHLDKCDVCSFLYNKSKNEVDVLMKLVSRVEPNQEDIAIPEFKNNKRNLALGKYLAWAASILFFFGLTWHYQNQAEKKNAITNACMEMEQLLYHSDPNKTWSKKEPIITITNNKGEIIYSNFED